MHYSVIRDEYHENTGTLAVGIHTVILFIQVNCSVTRCDQGVICHIYVLFKSQLCKQSVPQYHKLLGLSAELQYKLSQSSTCMPNLLSTVYYVCNQLCIHSVQIIYTIYGSDVRSSSALSSKHVHKSCQVI